MLNELLKSSRAIERLPCERMGIMTEKLQAVCDYINKDVALHHGHWQLDTGKLLTAVAHAGLLLAETSVIDDSRELYRLRRQSAEREWNQFAFLDEGFIVESSGGWESGSPANEWHRTIFTTEIDEQGGSVVGKFVVKFQPGNDTVLEAYVD
jgi:hypothetical protein